MPEGPVAERVDVLIETYEKRIGPRNVYNEINDNGFAGTTADAVADRELPGTYYTGGSNNSSASGVLKSTDGGKHWNRASVGLADPRIFALRADPTDAAVLHAGTPSGIFRSVDRAAHWALESGTAAFGLTRLFVEGQGSFQGWLFAAADHGIAYRAAGATGWAVSAAPGNAAIYFIAFSAPTPGTGTLYAVNNGDLYRVTVDAKALSFNWAKTASQGNTVTVDPGNVDHILFSHRGTGSADDYAVMESVDGGRTSKRLGNHTCWYVSFDPDDATYFLGRETVVSAAGTRSSCPSGRYRMPDIARGRAGTPRAPGNESGVGRPGSSEGWWVVGWWRHAVAGCRMRHAVGAWKSFGCASEKGGSHKARPGSGRCA
mgnify:CR=1 FL=1